MCMYSSSSHIKTAPNISGKRNVYYSEPTLIMCHIKSRSDLALLNISCVHKSASSQEQLCTELEF